MRRCPMCGTNIDRGRLFNEAPFCSSECKRAYNKKNIVYINNSDEPTGSSDDDGGEFLAGIFILLVVLFILGSFFAMNWNAIVNFFENLFILVLLVGSILLILFVLSKMNIIKIRNFMGLGIKYKLVIGILILIFIFGIGDFIRVFTTPDFLLSGGLNYLIDFNPIALLVPIAFLGILLLIVKKTGPTKIHLIFKGLKQKKKFKKLNNKYKLGIGVGLILLIFLFLIIILPNSSIESNVSNITEWKEAIKDCKIGTIWAYKDDGGEGFQKIIKEKDGLCYVEYKTYMYISATPFSQTKFCHYNTIYDETGKLIGYNLYSDTNPDCGTDEAFKRNNIPKIN